MAGGLCEKCANERAAKRVPANEADTTAIAKMVVLDMGLPHQGPLVCKMLGFRAGITLLGVL